jgi:hypothetical protein
MTHIFFACVAVLSGTLPAFAQRSPGVLFSSYFGGDRDDKPTALVRDRAGNVWVTGSTTSALTAENQPIQTESTGGRDVFLARLSPTRDGRLAISYWTLIGGSGNDEATAIAIDPLGMICLAGRTTSTDFPKAGTALQDEQEDTTDDDEEVFGGGEDAFVMRIDPNVQGADGLRFSRIYGGLGTEVATAIAVDASAAIYVAGYTSSDKIAGLIDQRSLQGARGGGYDAFLIKVVPDSEAPLVYATYLGGAGTDDVAAIAVRAEDQVYITGNTSSDNLPITFDAYEINRRSMYLAKLDISKPWLDGLEYATYLGGDAYDSVKSMAIDAEGMLWLAGYTASSRFPITFNGHQIANNGNVDGFALRFDYRLRSSPAAIAYATYLGGGEGDIVYGIAVLPDGSIALTGYTYSNNYPRVPIAAPVPALRPAGAFASIIDPARIGEQALIYSTVLDGALTDIGMAVAADGNNLLICGYTMSFDFPVTDASTKPSTAGNRTAFLVKAGPAQ